MGTSQTYRVLRRAGDEAEWRGEAVVVEAPLRAHLRHGGRTVLFGSTMRTPGHDNELVVGLALAEGVIRDVEDVVEVRPCAGDGRFSESDVLLILRPHVAVDEAALRRVAHPSSACGLCGRDQIVSLLSMLEKVPGAVVVHPEVVSALPDALQEGQVVFRRTGGLHAAGLFTTEGRPVVVREDVGRHNAVDKVTGAALLGRVEGDVLMVSGRVGFEIVQKAAMAGVPIVAAVSAPTSLAVDAAREVGITLAAFVRQGRMTVYSGDQRLKGTGVETAW